MNKIVSAAIAVLAAVALAVSVYTLESRPAQGVTSPEKVALAYVKEIGTLNGLTVESETVQAVRSTATGSVVLVKVRFHQNFYGQAMPSQTAVVRVRELKSSWQVTGAEAA